MPDRREVVAVGLGALSGPQQVEREATQNAETVGVIGAVALLVILFVACYAGGYVAGRMARFDRAKQGLAVWLWALAIAIIVAVVAVVAVVVAVAGSEYNVLSQLNSLPRSAASPACASTARWTAPASATDRKTTTVAGPHGSATVPASTAARVSLSAASRPDDDFCPRVYAPRWSRPEAAQPGCPVSPHHRDGARARRRS